MRPGLTFAAVGLFAAGLAAPPLARAETALPSAAEIAANPEKFLALAVQTFGWADPAPAAHIGGPLYFVGTRGLGVFLLKTDAGLILINTGMPGSGPMIESSIRDLGLDPEDIRICLAGHGHIDHVGALADLKARTGCLVAVMVPDVSLLESGGETDVSYGAVKAFGFEKVKVDRVLRDGDRITLGDMALTALNTPGHTRGATTFVFDITDGGKVYNVVILDGTGVNPGYRLDVHPTYPGIARDYMETFHRLELLTPDVWLTLHNENDALAEKIAASGSEGIDAFVDPAGYRAFIRAQRRSFEAAQDAEARE